MIHSPSTINEKVYAKIVRTLEQGFFDGSDHKPNHRVALALRIMHDAGLTTAKVTEISFKDLKSIPISKGTAAAALKYYRNSNVSSTEPIIGGTSYGLQKMVKYAADFLGYHGVTPDSFRQIHTPIKSKTARFSYTV